jgi:hypothetical protein
VDGDGILLIEIANQRFEELRRGKILSGNRDELFGSLIRLLLVA